MTKCALLINNNNRHYFNCHAHVWVQQTTPHSSFPMSQTGHPVDLPLRGNSV